MTSSLRFSSLKIHYCNGGKPDVEHGARSDLTPLLLPS